MGDFDSFFQADNTLQGTDKVWRDADTLEGPDGEAYRIEGYEAPEIAKLLGGDVESAGEAGGWQATETIRGLANEQGFTNIVETGEVDPFGRKLIRLQDSQGRDFTQELLNSGIADVGAYNSNKEIARAELARAFRVDPDAPMTEWEAGKLITDAAVQSEQLRANQFKQTALNEAWLATNNPKYAEGSVQIRHQDRDLQNNALNPLSESWDAGWTGVQEGLWGTLNLLGETTDWDWATEMSENGIGRARAKLSAQPNLKLSALNDKGEWDIDNIGQFFEYLGNNAAMSIPYMAATVGGTIAAPFTFGLSLSAPVAIYTGQTWNEMEGEKNAGVAIAAGVTQAVLDRIGLKGISGSILKKETLEAATKALASKNGISTATARQIIAGHTRKEIAQLAGDAAKVAGQQLKAGNLIRSMSQRAATGAVTEGVTEVLQEATAYNAAVIGSDKRFNGVELANRLANAAIAGGTLGAGFTAPATAYDVGAWHNVRVGQSKAAGDRVSTHGHWANKEKETYGRVASIQELNEQTGAAVARRGNVTSTFQDKAAGHKTRPRGGTVFERAGELWQEVPGLWRGATRHILPQQLQNRSRAARILGDMFGAGLQRTFHGSNFETRKHHLVTQFRNMVTSPATYAAAAGHTNLKTVNTAIQKLGDAVRAAEQADTDIDWDAVPQEHRAWLGQYYNEVQQLGDKLWAEQKRYNPDLGYVKNYFFHYKAFDKAAIEKNRQQFVDNLVEHKGFDHKEASELTDAILNTDMINGEGDFAVGQGKHIPGAHRARTLHLADDMNFQDFMEQNPFTNIANASKSASRFIAYQEFLGNNNEKINELLEQMRSEGISEAEVNKVAAGLQDYLDAESGNYKRIQNETWAKIQKNLMLWTTLAGLPLATISSIVELALTTRALTQDQIFGTIKNMGKQMAEGMWDAMKYSVPSIAGVTKDTQAGRRAKEDKQSTLQDLGYLNWEVGAATTTGVTETSHAHQNMLERYFKIIGLQQWTDYTRNIRAAIAGDFIFDKVALIRKQRDNAEAYTNEIQEAEEQLRNLGIDVDGLVDILRGQGNLTPEEEARMEQNMKEGMFNFINEAVALPQSYNRPLFYQNPHLALFTQFQGFIATFTANHIPKMWGELVARGTPAMKYNAFAVMSTMLVLGFASQYLKDLLKYGKPSPYLDDMEKLQRALGASGLLGTGERVLSFVNPIYETSSDNPAEWFFGAVSGEAAALSNVSRAVEAGAELAVGDKKQGAYKALKTTPFVGPINQLNRGVADFLFGE